MKLENKNIVITGTSTGMGKELVTLLSKKNKIAALSRSIDKLNDEFGGISSVVPIKCDVADKKSVKKAFDKVKKDLGKIDVIILNAGINRVTAGSRDVNELSKRIIETNFLGMVYCVNEVLAGFIKRKKGIIAGVSSIVDNRGYPTSGFYSASKSAVSVYLESLRIENKKFGIKVLTIKPGLVETKLTRNVKYKMLSTTPVDAAKKIIRGIEKERKLITFPCYQYLVSRINNFLPRFLFDGVFCFFLRRYHKLVKK